MVNERSKEKNGLPIVTLISRIKGQFQTDCSFVIHATTRGASMQITLI